MEQLLKRRGRLTEQRIVCRSLGVDFTAVRDKSGGKRRQKVEIIFNFVDEVEIPVLAEPMIAEPTLGRRNTA